MKMSFWLKGTLVSGDATSGRKGVRGLIRSRKRTAHATVSGESSRARGTHGHSWCRWCRRQRSISDQEVIATSRLQPQGVTVLILGRGPKEGT